MGGCFRGSDRNNEGMTRLAHIPPHEKLAGVISIITGVLLLGLKFGAYFYTGSAAVYSDAMEGIVNVVASGFAFYSLYLAHLPPDKEHPYGHGKIEFMSAGFEGGMIFLAAGMIALKAIEDFYRGPTVSGLGLGMLMLAAAMVINGGVGLYLVRVGKRNQSLTLEADGHHLMSDAVTSLTVIVALGIVQFTRWPYADPIAALMVAVYIAWMGARLLRRSASGLMDEQDLAESRTLQEILQSHMRPKEEGGSEPQICNYHKLRHRHSGRYHWVDFHIIVPATMNVAQGHGIATAIEEEMEAALGEGNATGHVEPCVTRICARCSGGKAEGGGVTPGAVPGDVALTAGPDGIPGGGEPESVPRRESKRT